ncbi:MAG: hypothetical protein L3K19_01365 [Thermoplasmata archaeon]|nr:hypothetical protein [Thermoplasmata archaeon]
MERTMDRGHLCWLLSLGLLLVFLSLEPRLSFAIFGSDTGEYYHLTSALVSTGHVPTGASYLGWGFAYPNFPGIFLLSATGSQAFGVDPLTALTTIVPVLSVLSVLPLFLLFRRLFPNDSVAILGAGFASVFMPRMFSLAHPAPLALGDFLVIGALWMFVEGRRDRRWYLPLALTAASLVVTHHLSSYFFLASALGSFVLLELWKPGLWSTRFPARELAFLTAFVLGMLAYWSAYAAPFLPILSEGSHGLPAGAVVVALGGGAVVGMVVLAQLIRWRRRRSAGSTRARVGFPSDRSLLRDAVVILSGLFLGVGLLIVVPLPATAQTTVPSAVVFFAPLLVSIPLASGTRRLVTVSRIGPLAIAWLLALGLSALFALSTNNPEILPSRHPEYLLIPVGLLIAVGGGRLVARWGDRSGRQALIAGSLGLVVLLAANAAIVYPPPSDFGGFQEGLTSQDAALWMWVGSAIPAGAVVASDHRLSSMIFGFDGNRATWDSTPALFVGKDPKAAMDELRGANAPHTLPKLLPINAVAVDETMRDTGVALDPSAPALPLSANASAWFDAPPFVAVYENGPEAVYWVDAPLIPTS